MTSSLVVRTFNSSARFDVQQLEPRLCLTAATSLGASFGSADPLRRPSLFGPPINSPAAAPVTLMAVGDFNGDHKPDVLARLGGDSALHLFPGDGAGKFGPAGPAVDAGINPAAIVTGDFNNDHVLDVAVANNPGPFATTVSTVTVLLGNGDGTFQSPRQFFAGNQPTALATADFNNDGNTDLVVANRGPWNVPGTLSPTSTGAAVLLGNGDGTFKLAAKIPMFEQYSVATGDVNGDGNPDAVFATNNPLVMTPLPLSQLNVATGDGSGVFTTHVVTGIPGRAPAVVVADLNGDKLDDIAALGTSAAFDSTTSANFVSSAVHTFLTNADGTVTPISTVGTNVSAPAGLSVADFNGDHRLDFAVAGAAPLASTLPTAAGGAVAVMFGLGKGRISAPALFRTGASPQAQAVLDVNGDGRPDILTGGTIGISTLLNQGVPPVAFSVQDAVDAVTLE